MSSLVLFHKLRKESLKEFYNCERDWLWARSKDEEKTRRLYREQGIKYRWYCGERATREKTMQEIGRKTELRQEGINKEASVALGKLCVRYFTEHRKCVDETLGNRLHTSPGLGDNPWRNSGISWTEVKHVGFGVSILIPQGTNFVHRISIFYPISRLGRCSWVRFWCGEDQGVSAPTQGIWDEYWGTRQNHRRWHRYVGMKKAKWWQAITGGTGKHEEGGVTWLEIC